MERSTTYRCHFIDQPLSSFILGIDPPELPSHARWWIEQTSSVGGRDFLPKLWGCFKFSSFTELVQRLMTCWLFSVLLTSLKDRLDCSYVEGLLVPLPHQICQYGMSPGFSLCNKPLLSLLVLQHFAFPTFWELSETIVDTF